MRKKNNKIIVITLVLVLIILSRILKLNELISLDTLISDIDNFRTSINSNIVFYSILFVLSYAGIVALALPFATVLSLSAGLILGIKLGVVLVVIGATLGATVNFILTRYLFGEQLQNKYSKKLMKINKELESNGSNYLLTLRLIPLFPFFLINIAAGLSNITLKTFIWTTALGIIPGVFAYVYLGTSIASLSEESGLSTNVILALILIGIIALLPVIYKKNKISRFNK